MASRRTISTKLVVDVPADFMPKGPSALAIVALRDSGRVSLQKQHKSKEESSPVTLTAPKTTPGDVPAYLQTAGELDTPKLQRMIDAFYAIVDPTREQDRKQGLVQSILNNGWTAVNDAMQAKYQKDLTIVEKDFLTAGFVHWMVEEYCKRVPQMTPHEKNQLTYLLTSEGWKKADTAVASKYGMTLNEAALSAGFTAQHSSKQPTNRPNGGVGAPTQEGPMNAEGAAPEKPQSAFVSGKTTKKYSISSESLTVSFLTLGCLSVCTVKDEASGSTLVMKTGCTAYECYLDGKYIGRVSRKFLPGCQSTFPYAATFRDPTGKVLARSYISQNCLDCFGCCYSAFVLHVEGICTLRAGQGCCADKKNLLYEDESNPECAIRFSEGTCCSSGTALVNGNIPIWAVALIPFRKSNENPCTEPIKELIYDMFVKPTIRLACGELGLPDNIPLDAEDVVEMAIDHAADQAAGEEEEEPPADEEGGEVEDE